MEYTKEKIIELWNSFCIKTISDPEQFINFDLNCYSLRINTKVSLEISNFEKDKYELSLMFCDFIRYKTFELSQKEFLDMEDSFEKGKLLSEKITREQIIFEGKECLDNLLMGINS